eukprot:2620032-Rhodomonas_salina.4
MCMWMFRGPSTALPIVHGTRARIWADSGRLQGKDFGAEDEGGLEEPSQAQVIMHKLQMREFRPAPVIQLCAHSFPPSHLLALRLPARTIPNMRGGRNGLLVRVHACSDSPVSTLLCAAGYTTLKDSFAPHTTGRWIATVVLFLIYCVRIYLING